MIGSNFLKIIAVINFNVKVIFINLAVVANVKSYSMFNLFAIHSYISIYTLLVNSRLFNKTVM